MRIKTIIGLVLVAGLLLGCQSQNTYSKLRKKEKETISAYIEREGINVLDEIPSTWGEKDYYAVPNYDDFYIHVIEADTRKQVEAGNTIQVRYKKYGLGAYSDTIRYWTTEDGADPITFQFELTSDPFYCLGWTVAIEVMKYSKGRCRIICPSKMGFTEDNSSVTPYGYELKYQVQPF